MKLVLGVEPHLIPEAVFPEVNTDAELAERRAAMLAALPVGVVLLDRRGTVVEANPAAYSVLGLGETSRSLAALARRISAPIGGDPIPPADLPWQRALAGETVRDRDLAITMDHPNGERRLVTVSASPYYDPVAAATGALVIAFDRVQLLLRQTHALDLPPYLQRVLWLLRQGRATTEIARELNLTVGTTRLYIKRLYARLGVRSRSQLMLRAMQLGLDS